MLRSPTLNFEIRKLRQRESLQLAQVTIFFNLQQIENYLKLQLPQNKKYKQI